MKGDLAWWCELSQRNPIPYGPHTICYRAPAFKGQPAIESCVEFTLLHPTGEDARALEHYKGDPLKGKDLVERFPNSNYAALALWQEGLMWYEGGAMPEMGAQKDFDFYAQEKKNRQPISFNRLMASRKSDIADPWERLYREFPTFAYRARLLYALGRCYFQLGEYNKAVPLLQELLNKYPDTEWAKKGAAYKEVLVQHQYWPKE